MLVVSICVGSSCHLKGSYAVIKTFEELIGRHGLEDRVELKAAFCLGHCTTGVSARIGEEAVDGLTPANAERVFKEYILEKVRP